MTVSPPELTVQKADTVVVFIDPQNDVLSEKGTSWEAVGVSVIENKTRENMERIFKSLSAKKSWWSNLKASNTPSTSILP